MLGVGRSALLRSVEVRSRSEGALGAGDDAEPGGAIEPLERVHDGDHGAIEEAVAAAHRSASVSGRVPMDSDPRREVVVVFDRGLLLPPKAEIQREVWGDREIVLEECLEVALTALERASRPHGFPDDARSSCDR